MATGSFCSERFEHSFLMGPRRDIDQEDWLIIVLFSSGTAQGSREPLFV